MLALFSLALIVASVFSPFPAAIRHRSTLPALLGVLPVLGVESKKTVVPEITINYFDHLPKKLHYFEDTKTVLYFDIDLYFSENEGKSWVLVDEIPRRDGRILIEHPFDSLVAFLLTRGTKHYMTQDGGRTWESFEAPFVPSLEVEVPLAFHANPQKSGYILYQGTRCDNDSPDGWRCYEETHYTTNSFSDLKKLQSFTSRCLFARSSKEFYPIQNDDDLIFCHHVEDASLPEESTLVSSSDFFVEDVRLVNFGPDSRSRGVVGISALSKYLVASVLHSSEDSSREMAMYVASNSTQWNKAHFPHNTASMIDSPHTFVEEASRSLVVNIQPSREKPVGTLFTSDPTGRYFVESLKNTHYMYDLLDFMELTGVQGVRLVNQIQNAREIEAGWDVIPRLKTVITRNDGSSWDVLKAPERDMHGIEYDCHTNTTRSCSLNLHLMLPMGYEPPSPPGFIFAIGSVSETLRPYEESDTYLSRDAGLTWMQVRHGAHRYAFGDNGNLMVLIDDEKPTDHVRYSIDSGTSWKRLDLGTNVRARHLGPVSGLSSQQFVLLGITRPSSSHEPYKFVTAIHLDFTRLQTRVCEDSDLEVWHPLGNGTDCILGQKQSFWRRKPDAGCYEGDVAKHPDIQWESCLCSDADFGCDFNYAREEGECVHLQPQPIPADACLGDASNKTYLASSGYRLIPGNTCEREGGLSKDEPVEKPCSEEKPGEGEVAHQIFKFSSGIADHHYFRNSKTILAELWDRTIWQSTDEGYTWHQLFNLSGEFVVLVMHPYSDDRAYLLTTTEKYQYTIDGGRSWRKASTPFVTSRYGSPSLSFHPTEPDYLIWTGDVDCSYEGPTWDNCHVDAYISLNHGKQWELIESYVRKCEFAEALGHERGSKGIICSSHRDKTGSQHGSSEWNPLEFIIGHNWYTRKEKLFDHILGFENSADYLYVTAVALETFSLDLYVSRAGGEFVKTGLPPGAHLDKDTWMGSRTVVQSTQNVTFLQIGVSTNWNWRARWGNLLKSDGNSTFYGSSLDYVDTSMRGQPEYYPISGFDGVAVANVLTNPNEAVYTGRKKIHTRITHNDGGSWQLLDPPARDSYGAIYPCDSPECSLHLQGRNATRNSAIAQGDASAVGTMLAVGNVGKSLSSYMDSDMFITRDAGFTWEEVHKGTHIWTFGDSGSILVMVNDGGPTDYVEFTTDDGLHWKKYNFGVSIWPNSISTIPGAGSRKFMLIGYHSHPSEWRSPPKAVVIYLNFAELTGRACEHIPSDPSQSDFEIWNSHQEGQCLLGSQTSHYRKKRSSNCYIGDLVTPPPVLQRECACTEVDFECDYNHARNTAGECVIIPGTIALASDTSCSNEEFWYERTPYRKISKSMCVGGTRLDRGEAHHCHGHWFRAHATLLWCALGIVPLGIILAALWYYKRRSRKGPIHLPDGDERSDLGSRTLSGIASIPSSIVGGLQKLWGYVRTLPVLPRAFNRPRRANQGVALGEDS